MEISGELFSLIDEADKRNRGESRIELPGYIYPRNVLCVQDFDLAKHGQSLCFSDEDLQFTRALDAQKEKGKAIFGGGFLLSEAAAAKKSKAEELEALLDKYIPGVETMRTKLKKYDKTYKELTAENAELEKELNSASRESIQKKLEIQRKLSELDELRRTMNSIPDAIIREYTERKYVHHGRMNQEI